MNTKRVLSLFIALALSFSYLLMPAYAATPQGLSPLFDDSSTSWPCPSCGMVGTILQEQWEIGYYYNRLWITFECNRAGGCGHIWTILAFEYSKNNLEEPREKDSIIETGPEHQVQ